MVLQWLPAGTPKCRVLIALQGIHKQRENEVLSTYGCLVPVWRSLLLGLPRVLLSLAVVPLQALINHNLQAAMLLSHLHFVMLPFQTA